MGSPSLSVIIPTHDRPARLAGCLRALARQDYPRDRWEVVVVDDGTPDAEGVRRVVESLRDELDVQLVRQVRSGPAAARNAGASRARNDYLAFTDDDCEPRVSWLSEFAAAFEREPHSVFGGATENGLGANLWSEASHQLVEYVVEYFCERGTPFFPSNNIALARASFEQIGGFDVTFPLAAGEDREFCARCQAAGFTLAAVPHAVLEHYHALSLRSFVRQHMNYGRGAFLFHLREAERKKSGVHVEPMKFYVNLVRRPFGPEGADRRRIRLAALLVLSQIANAAGFFAERFKIRRTATCW